MSIASNILLGTVVDTADPDGLGRIQVQLHGFRDVWKTPWLRVIQPTASATEGHHFLPEKETEVVVLRGLGDHVEGLLVLGSLYNAEAKPKVTKKLLGADNNIKEIRTRGGSRLHFDDTDGKEKLFLETKNGTLKIAYDVENGKLDIIGDKEVNITSAAKLTITAKEAVINAETSAHLTTAEATIEAKTVNLKGTSTVNADSALTIDCGGALTLKGTKIALGG